MVINVFHAFKLCNLILIWRDTLARWQMQFRTETGEDADVETGAAELCIELRTQQCTERESRSAKK